MAGQGGLSIATSDGGKSGYFGFQNKGQATFANLSSALTINGTPYTLVGDIATLAADIAANSAGNYALASDYNAENDGAYSNSPIPTEFGGAFEGLGNTISNLSLNGTGNVNDPVGLFAELALNDELGGSIENINLENLSIGGSGIAIGGLVGVNEGTVSGSFVGGSVAVSFQQGVLPTIGALVGFNDYGSILRSSVKAAISSDAAGSQVGGLTGESGGSISQSFAQCKVSAGGGTYLGELVGDNIGLITESYAGGSITGGEDSEIGGLVGDNAEESTISQSYSTAALKDIPNGDRDAGGLIGIDDSPRRSNASDYWDMTTSHIKGRSDGAGTPRNDPGIQGRSTEQLQSGLPKGFDPTVWAEDPKINNGFPYLIANPPRKD